MKLENISAGELIALLKRSSKAVYLAADDGVLFNLSSTLSLLYCIRMMLESAEDGTLSPEIKFESTEDEKLFRNYLRNRDANRAKLHN
ncbi:MAG: hypothetical protein GX424_08725 [Clostridiales bacterium]|jgi:hypothetical protein|nr:hypothetical protein [Clostridiales bacterium]